MKTNQELFLEELTNASPRKFVDLISSEKCSRCSNHYWDMAQNKCHSGINDSTCEEGQAEYLESRPDEDLQAKYHKKYWSCKDRKDAKNKLELVRLLCKTGLIGDADICTRCSNREGLPCRHTDCDQKVTKLQEMYKEYIKQAASQMGHIEANQVFTTFTMEKYLWNVLIPSITNPEIKEQVSICIKKAYPNVPKTAD